MELWEEGNDDSSPLYAREAADKAVPLFGLPAESDWVLNGPFSDKTQLNNFLTFNWSRDAGLYAPRSMHVEVFVNRNGGTLDMAQDYVGTYVLLEKIKSDKNRVDIEEMKPSDNDPDSIVFPADGRHLGWQVLGQEQQVFAKGQAHC